MALELICLFRAAEQAEEALTQLEQVGLTIADLGLISHRQLARPRPNTEAIESVDVGKIWLWGPLAFELLGSQRALKPGLEKAGIQKPEEFVQPLLEGASILAVSGVGGRVPEIRVMLEHHQASNIKLAPEIAPLDRATNRYIYSG
jgi:hypothetical protein